MSDTISRDELAAAIDHREVTVVEALPEQYFEHEHLPGAISVPFDSPRERIDAALPDKDAAIVTYCASLTCPDSAQLAKRLTDLGYTSVRDYEEGKADWIDAGRPTERGAAAAASA